MAVQVSLDTVISCCPGYDELGLVFILFDMTLVAVSMKYIGALSKSSMRCYYTLINGLMRMVSTLFRQVLQKEAQTSAYVSFQKYFVQVFHAPCLSRFEFTGY